MARFIYNADEDINHGVELSNLFQDANHISWHIAFATMNGIEYINTELCDFLDAGHSARIIIGLDYYHTDPEVLDYFHDLSCNHTGQINFFIGDQDRGSVFHPKTYVFYYGDDDDKFARVLIGSANLTSGGLYGNYEFSAALLFRIGDNGKNPFLVNLENHANSIIEDGEVTLATTALIEQYRNEHRIHNLHRRLANRKAQESIARSQDEINPDPYEYFRIILADYKERMPPNNFHGEVQQRIETRAESRNVLNRIREEQPWEHDEFLELYNQLVYNPHLFHSDRIHVHRRNVARTNQHFADGLVDLQRNMVMVPGLTPRDAYNILQQHFLSVNGVGVNILTEVLHAYDNTHYAVMNKLSVRQLQTVSTAKFPNNITLKTITGNIYQTFCDEAWVVCRALGLNNFTEFDALMNYDYWS